MKRREVKGKGEKERYAYLNAEFQRIARRWFSIFNCVVGVGFVVKQRRSEDLREVPFQPGEIVKKRKNNYTR